MQHAPVADAAIGAPPDSLPAAVVLNLHETGLGIARSLGRRGVRVIGLSADPRAPGMGTRYADCRTAPDSQTAPAELAAFLARVGAELGDRPVLLPTNDADLGMMDRHRANLARWFRLALPPSDLLHTMLDKVRLSDLARQHGIATPVTRRVDSMATLDACAAALTYPAVIKPLDTTSWRTSAFVQRVGVRKGVRVADADAAREAYGRIAAVAPAAMVQEWVDGPEDGYRIVGAAIGAGGRPLGAFAARKHLQYPPGIGLGCLLEARPEPELVDRTLDFLVAIGFRGVCEAEYKLDRRTGAAHLIEINPRHWDQHTLGACLGVDLSWLAYRDAIGCVPEAFRRAEGRAVWVRARGVAGSLKAAIKRRDPAIGRSLWRAVRVPRCYALWASDDIGPVVQALSNRWSRGANG